VTWIVSVAYGADGIRRATNHLNEFVPVGMKAAKGKRRQRWRRCRVLAYPLVMANEPLREAWRRADALIHGIEQARTLIPHDMCSADGVLCLASENAAKAMTKIEETANRASEPPREIIDRK
jgi:hypothetical protein